MKTKTPPQSKGPEEILGVSLSPFSIARYYGGIKYNGTTYIYDPTRDALIRDDIHKARMTKPKVIK